MCLREFPTRPDTNRPAQPQKLASLEISAIESRDIILSKQRTTKVLISMCGCAGWSAPLLFAYDMTHFLMARLKRIGFLATQRVPSGLIRLHKGAGWTESSLGACHYVGFVMFPLIFHLQLTLDQSEFFQSLFYLYLRVWTFKENTSNSMVHSQKHLDGYIVQDRSGPERILKWARAWQNQQNAVCALQRL